MVYTLLDLYRANIANIYWDVKFSCLCNRQLAPPGRITAPASSQTLFGLTEETGKQRYQGDTDEGNAATDHELFYPQLGVKLCSMAGGGVQKIYMVLLREPSRRDRPGSDLFHLRDGFGMKMNFDRNVSCFIFVNALMHNDFFD